ncbi:MmgE/PrpD family protein [Bradyrhizobium sp. SSUT18]|uniref:MmgE/PrpD family protein n=1 Tax=Bradyrhizobium sp. SSUT18 TaxID=3040602 RepID=UPI0024470B97|nr:MmgE/PrpD family protein [Bradyrhizobium sp. SSUT18]MDH2398389.1 MmgE/PrpD family protein [Bradyrhizobium sp. SSUT18]
MSIVSSNTLELRLAELIVQDTPKVSETETCQASRHVADLVGVALAGTKLPAFDRLVSLSADLPEQGRLSARIWGSNRRVSLREAGLINAFAGHIHDFDDDEVEYSLAHLTVTAATAAIVAADACPGVSGAEVMKAYLVASEAAMRLGEIINPDHYRRGWHSSATLGSFAACAAAGRILGLTPLQMRQALGMCASLASGIRANFGSDTKPLQVGHAVRNGIFAVEAAKAGLTAAAGALFGEAGFGSLFQKGRDLETIIDGFGEPYRLLGGSMVIKAYPCCTASHTAIYSMLTLKAEHRFSGSDIAKITCHIDPVVPGILIYDRPTNGTEAKFSMPYCLAVAAQVGKVGVAEFTLENGLDANIRSVMERTTMLTDATLPKGPSGASVSSRIEIELRDGRRFERFQEFAPGSAGAPLSDDALEKKFRECLSSESSNSVSALFHLLLGAGSIASFSDCIDRFVMQTRELADKVVI